MDVKNEGPSLDACTDIIKRGVRQTRYHLKRKYFDESLSREQLLAKEPPPKMKKEEWIKLVEYWCDPKNQVHDQHQLLLLIWNANCACQCKLRIAFVVQERCAKNKVNRGQVQLHQRTGSRSYIAHRYSLVSILLLLPLKCERFWRQTWLPDEWLEPFRYYAMQTVCTCLLESSLQSWHCVFCIISKKDGSILTEYLPCAWFVSSYHMLFDFLEYTKTNLMSSDF